MPRIGLSRDRLVEAAAKLADEHGFDKLTLAALARHFAVKLASLYSHVKNSDDLKTSVALFALSELADRADEAVAGRAGKDALVALANVHRNFAREHPGLFEAARFRLDATSAAVSGGARLSRTTQAVLRGYALTDTDCTHAIRLLGSFFLGFPVLESAGSFSHSQPEAEASWSRSLNALDALLRGWALP
ncbi:TetR/AcrR family transcriptional regulator [Pseudaminobacter soli (ex Li et al. 2025)]|uniref:TetR family transcriptional regulator n=1 Tax=Pseudaminobacter soli (ex Li et al. 2025) TaxID=1295366 RepID=A0A2P7S2E9_9HYPH|nr:TetR/AcrR family transcriptional regulator [Mesorhizobium soli]PSJ56647.1 TetR family transcriptional regulator [Mesorhizobium soli]